MTDRLPAIEPDARDLVAAVRAYVDEAMKELLRLRLQENGAAAAAYAADCMSDVARKLEPLVAAHDALAAALNMACPDAEPVLSLSTEEPA